MRTDNINPGNQDLNFSILAVMNTTMAIIRPWSTLRTRVISHRYRPRARSLQPRRLAPPSLYQSPTNFLKQTLLLFRFSRFFTPKRHPE